MLSRGITFSSGNSLVILSNGPREAATTEAGETPSSTKSGWATSSGDCFYWSEVASSMAEKPHQNFGTQCPQFLQGLPTCAHSNLLDLILSQSLL